MIDMESEGKQLGAPEITRLQALKTGRLIQYAAEAGAILGHASPQQRHLIAAYGRELGGAFQIYDDVLDEIADAATLGKTAGKDAAQGKATMVSILGLDRAKAQAEKLAEQAAGHLESFGDRADLLRALARFTVTRKS
jgi:farnesyl diphosphate synthase